LVTFLLDGLLMVAKSKIVSFSKLNIISNMQ
jgi:hypothetical protein